MLSRLFYLSLIPIQILKRLKILSILAFVVALFCVVVLFISLPAFRATTRAGLWLRRWESCSVHRALVFITNNFCLETPWVRHIFIIMVGSLLKLCLLKSLSRDTSVHLLSIFDAVVVFILYFLCKLFKCTLCSDQVLTFILWQMFHADNHAIMCLKNVPSLTTTTTTTLLLLSLSGEIWLALLGIQQKNTLKQKQTIMNCFTV